MGDYKGKTIKIGDLSKVINQSLRSYSRSVTDGIKKAVDVTADELKKNIRRDAPKRTGKYARAGAIATEYEDTFSKRKIWYVKGKYYKLTHLLENGHNIVRNKVIIGHAPPYPHIQKNEEIATKNFERRVKEVIENESKRISRKPVRAARHSISL